MILILDYMGLSKTVAELIGGGETDVDPLGFSNDLVTFKDKDDVLTLLIHLGYLAYNSETRTVRIPNEEIRREFEEIPAGAEIADIIYFPKKKTELPALLIELKWDKSAKGAIDRIKDKNLRLNSLFLF